jgi:hypothetical protein
MANMKMYCIPDRFRRSENLHIVFWLIKDISWAMLWKPIGLTMLAPTLVLAIMITIRTKKLKSEFFHNLAVVFWITANGYWMITEFFWPEHDSLRYYSAIPFVSGIICIAWYYLIELPKEKKTEKLVSVTIDIPETIVHLAQAKK